MVKSGACNCVVNAFTEHNRGLESLRVGRSVLVGTRLLKRMMMMMIMMMMMMMMMIMMMVIMVMMMMMLLLLLPYDPLPRPLGGPTKDNSYAWPLPPLKGGPGLRWDTLTRLTPSTP